MKVLKFGAVWCTGCLVMKPRWEKIDLEHDWLETIYYDADEHPELIDQYDIKSIPSVILLDKSGNEFDRLVGEFEEAELVTVIEKYKDK